MVDFGSVGSSGTIRLDPAPSRVFTWVEYVPDAPEVLDENGRCLRPQTSLIRVRYRTTGMEMESWPCSEEEAKLVMNPGARFGYSIGSAFSQVIRAVGKSSRQIKSGERQSTVKQREETEQRAGRRWLA